MSAAKVDEREYPLWQGVHREKAILTPLLGDFHIKTPHTRRHGISDSARNTRNLFTEKVASLHVKSGGVPDIQYLRKLGFCVPTEKEAIESKCMIEPPVKRYFHNVLAASAKKLQPKEGIKKAQQASRQQQKSEKPILPTIKLTKSRSSLKELPDAQALSLSRRESTVQDSREHLEMASQMNFRKLSRSLASRQLDEIRSFNARITRLETYMETITKPPLTEDKIRRAMLRYGQSWSGTGPQTDIHSLRVSVEDEIPGNLTGAERLQVMGEKDDKFVRELRHHLGLLKSTERRVAIGELSIKKGKKLSSAKNAPQAKGLGALTRNRSSIKLATHTDKKRTTGQKSENPGLIKFV